MGKAAIVYSVLGAEGSSWLFVDPHSNDKMDFERLEPTWYAALGRIIVERRPVQDADLVARALQPPVLINCWHIMIRLDPGPRVL